jgi:hypothetical protein
MVNIVTFHEVPHVVGQLYGVPHEILRVCNTILYENVFQNPELFGTQVSLSPEQSTLHVVKNGQTKFLRLFHWTHIVSQAAAAVPSLLSCWNTV